MSIASVSTKFSSFTLDNYKLIHFIFIILWKLSTKSEISSEWNPFKVFIKFLQIILFDSLDIVIKVIHSAT